MQPRAPSPSPPGQPSVALARFQGHDPRGGPARGVSPSVISLARSLAATCTDLDLAGCQHRAVAPGAARWALLPMASTAATTYVEPSLAARRRWPPRRRPRSLCGGRRLGRPSTWSVPTVAKHAPQPSGSARCQGSPRRGGGGGRSSVCATHTRVQDLLLPNAFRIVYHLKVVGPATPCAGARGGSGLGHVGMCRVQVCRQQRNGENHAPTGSLARERPRCHAATAVGAPRTFVGQAQRVWSDPTQERL